MSTPLIYGANGYVGELVAREAIDRGIEPILAGRDRDTLSVLAAQLGCPARRFDLAAPGAVRSGVADVDCVVNCAGPFSNTAGELVGGCLQTETDYVDITGEIPVIERVRGWDEVARERDVTLFPSAGFSSVPLSCLAAHLVAQLPDATHLSLGVDSWRVPSRGSLQTVIEGAETGGAVCLDGVLQRVPAAWRTREIDFGRGERPAVTMPLGDVSTAHHATGVPNVDAYAMQPLPGQLALRAHRYVAPAFSWTPVQWTLERLAGLVREGPSERARERGSAYCWGEARVHEPGGRTPIHGDRPEERVVSRLETPDPYAVTVDAAVTVTERVLAGDVEPGYQTAPDAFGPEFVTELQGIEGFEDELGALAA